MASYKEFVENLASEGRDELFFNSGPTHAAIVMSRIFKYSSDIIRIYCGGFNGAISNDEEYLKYLELFLKKGGNLKILVEEDLSKQQSKIYGILQKYKSNVEFYPTPFRVIGSKGKPMHFTVGDDKMLRLETGVDDYTAQVNFGNKDDAKIFSNIFDDLLNKSKVKVGSNPN